MSANLVVDIQNTCQYFTSLAGTGVGGVPASGAQIGRIVDLKDSNTYTNLFAVVTAGTSGSIAVQIQTSDAVASGNFFSGGGVPPSGTFTDPTSGLAAFPNNISSGGIWWVNSGLYSVVQGGGLSGTMNVGTFGAGIDNIFNGMGPNGLPLSGSWPAMGSGGIAFSAFQRPSRFARLNVLSGAAAVSVIAGFVANLRTTGSGGGFTLSPGSGAVNV